MVFFNFCFMTASIPNGFSPEELQRMLAEAQPEPETNEDFDQYTRNELAVQHFEAVNEFMDNICEGTDVPPQLVAKMVMHGIVDRMIQWHSSVAVNASESDDHSCALGWARDAGKFQAIANILDSIKVTDDDPTCGSLG